MRNILLIDDDTDFTAQVIHVLKGHCRFTVAETLEEGIRLFESDQPDAVILDLNLPDSTSDGTVGRFKRMFPFATIIAVSGDDDPEVIRNTIMDNASGYVVKGRDDQKPEKFMREIEQGIETHGWLLAVNAARHQLK